MRYEIIMKGLLLIILISFIVFTYAFIRLKGINEKKGIKKSFGKDSRILLKIHNFLLNLPFFKVYLFKVETKLKFIELSDEKTIQEKSTQLILYAFLFTALIGLVLFYSVDSLYFLLLGIMMLIIINQQFLKLYLSDMEKKLLVQFEDFLSEVKHHYHTHEMIDEAVYDTTTNVSKRNFEMSLHAKKMYEILSSETPEDAMDTYYDLAPNKFFKNFIALAHLVQKFGDKIVNEESVFLRNINYLKQEIKYELLRKERLNYLFKSLSIITVLPLFFIKPLEKWALMNLPELSIYFDGKYGFYIDIGTFILVITAYLLISRMKNDEMPMVNRNESILDKLLLNRWINKLINQKINSNYSQYLKDKMLLKDASYMKSVQIYYLTKFVVGVSIFLIANLVMIHAITISSNQLLLTKDSPLSKTDKAYVLALKYEPKEESAYEFIKSEEALSEKVLIEESNRIFKKVVAYNELYFKWWYLLLAFFFGLIGYYWPTVLLHFKKKMRLMTIEEEVIQMHTIILMLMYFERISVEEVLKWMEQFSLIFRSSINKCLNDFESGDLKALKALKAAEGYTSFARIVDNLINASEKIPLALAFDELVIERKYYQEKRKQDNELLIEKKGIIGKLIAFAPLSFTVLFYLLLPFLMFSITQLLNYSTQMKDIL